jgi:hypothetical protein
LKASIALIIPEHEENRKHALIPFVVLRVENDLTWNVCLKLTESNVIATVPPELPHPNVAIYCSIIGHGYVDVVAMVFAVIDTDIT